MMRFTQRDPIGFAAGDINLYAYVGNNPVNRVDPSGFTAADPMRLMLAAGDTSYYGGSTMSDVGPRYGITAGSQSLCPANCHVENYQPGEQLSPLQQKYLASEVLDPSTWILMLVTKRAPPMLKVETAEINLVSTAAKSENFIYRAASGTPASMTTRAIDTKGLSAADSFANALPGKNQIIDTSKFKSLCAVCDNAATGHVSITPKDIIQLQSWINSRGATDIHPLTRELMNAVVGTVKK